MLDLRDFCSGGVLHYSNNFTDYLIAPEEMKIGKPPRVMVETGEWEKVCHGLLDRGLCTLLPKSQLFHDDGVPLLSGLFSVSKQEWQGEIEICRLIINLRALKSICMAPTGDTPTLPSITNMGALCLDDDEALCISSEDVRCFFYLFSVPEAWFPYMGFGCPVGDMFKPSNALGEDYFLCSRVLPMGFLNSVGIAQHVHRAVV